MHPESVPLRLWATSRGQHPGGENTSDFGNTEVPRIGILGRGRKSGPSMDPGVMRTSSINRGPWCWDQSRIASKLVGYPGLVPHAAWVDNPLGFPQVPRISIVPRNSLPLTRKPYYDHQPFYYYRLSKNGRERRVPGSESLTREVMRRLVDDDYYNLRYVTHQPSRYDYPTSRRSSR